MKHKGPGRNKCPDCKGSGVYQGLGAPGPCQACGGAGEFIGIKVDLENDVYPKGTCKADWDQLAEALKTCEDADRVINIKAKPGVVHSPIEGELVYVYDAGWYEAEIKSVYDGGVRGERMVKADHTCGMFRIPVKDICWNITDNRWEHIRSGTPVW